MIRAVAALVAVIAGIWLAVDLGHDANWDLRNYHLHNAWALLDWRYDLDVMPVGEQSLLSPLVDLPYYLALDWLGLRAATVLLALFFALYLFLLWELNRAAFAAPSLAPALGTDAAGRRGQALRWGLPLLATFLGASGSAAVAQAATTYNEVQLALLVVAGVVLVLPRLESGAPLPAARLLGAGACLGAAAGLKLTAALYVPAFGLALVAALLTARRPFGLLAAIRAGALYSAGVLAAFAAVYGPWGLMLWLRFESPLFPYFNAVFRSPWLPAENFRDLRFGPDSPADWALHPLNWAFRLSTEASEPLMRDPRLLLFLLAALALAGLRTRLVLASPSLRFLLVFATAAYVLWLAQFSILRYAVAIEGVGATLTVLAATLLWSGRARLAALAVLAVLVPLVTDPPNWKRMKFRIKTFAVEAPTLPDGSVVLVASRPIGFVLPSIGGEGLRFVEAHRFMAKAEGHRLFDTAAAIVREAPGPLWVLTRSDGVDTDTLARLGVRPTEDCAPVTTNLEGQEIAIALCRAERLAP